MGAPIGCVTVALTCDVCPTTSDSDAGCALTCVTPGCVAVTVALKLTVIVLLVYPAPVPIAETATLADPAPTAVTTPTADTVMTDASLLL